jgi:hypothetical protein
LKHGRGLHGCSQLTAASGRGCLVEICGCKRECPYGSCLHASLGTGVLQAVGESHDNSRWHTQAANATGCRLHVQDRCLGHANYSIYSMLYISGLFHDRRCHDRCKLGNVTEPVRMHTLGGYRMSVYGPWHCPLHPSCCPYDPSVHCQHSLCFVATRPLAVSCSKICSRAGRIHDHAAVRHAAWCLCAELHTPQRRSAPMCTTSPPGDPTQTDAGAAQRAAMHSLKLPVWCFVCDGSCCRPAVHLQGGPVAAVQGLHQQQQPAHGRPAHHKLEVLRTLCMLPPPELYVPNNNVATPCGSCSSAALKRSWCAPQVVNSATDSASTSSSSPGLLAKLGRVLREKAAGDYDRFFKGTTKTRERLGVRSTRAAAGQTGHPFVSRMCTLVCCFQCLYTRRSACSGSPLEPVVAQQASNQGLCHAPPALWVTKEGCDIYPPPPCVHAAGGGAADLLVLGGL